MLLNMDYHRYYFIFASLKKELKKTICHQKNQTYFAPHVPVLRKRKGAYIV